MPPKPTRKSRRRNQTVGTDRGVVNVPSVKNAPRAKSPRVFGSEKEARDAQRRLGRRLAARGMSSTRGSKTPGGGKTKPKRAQSKRKR